MESIPRLFARLCNIVYSSSILESSTLNREINEKEALAIKELKNAANTQNKQAKLWGSSGVFFLVSTLGALSQGDKLVSVVKTISDIGSYAIKGLDNHYSAILTSSQGFSQIHRSTVDHLFTNKSKTQEIINLARQLLQEAQSSDRNAQAR